MNIGEANATSTLLHFLMPGLSTRAHVRTDEAREAAAYLAERAGRAVSIRPPTTDRMDEEWDVLLAHLDLDCDCGCDPEPTGRPITTITPKDDLL